MTDSEGGLYGPFNAMLLSPPLGNALQAPGATIRYRSRLTDRQYRPGLLDGFLAKTGLDLSNSHN